MDTDATASLFRDLASIERGQTSVLVQRVSLHDRIELLVADSLITFPRIEDWSIRSVLASLESLGVQAGAPVEDSAESVYDITQGGHIVWVEALQYVGNFYRSALVEERPAARITQMHYGDLESRICAALGDGPERSYTFPMDGSYDVMSIAFDTAYCLRTGTGVLF